MMFNLVLDLFDSFIKVAGCFSVQKISQTFEPMLLLYTKKIIWVP